MAAKRFRNMLYSIAFPLYPQVACPVDSSAGGLSCSLAFVLTEVGVHKRILDDDWFVVLSRYHLSLLWYRHIVAICTTVICNAAYNFGVLFRTRYVLYLSMLQSVTIDNRGEVA